jgi:hypothetical protein
LKNKALTHQRRTFVIGNATGRKHRVPNIDRRTFSSTGIKLPNNPSGDESTGLPVSQIGSHPAFIGVGSNVGDRVEMIEKACNAMDNVDGIRLLRTSGLWETEPMYVKEQGNFINGVCEVGKR